MKKWLVITALILVVGCSSTPDKLVTYLLPSGNTGSAAHHSNDQNLLIVPQVDLAAYLANMGLVYQVSPTEIVEARQRLWAEALSKQLTRRITYDLRQKQTGFWPIQLTSTLSTVDIPRLQIRINRFNGVYTGVAEVAGEWMLISANGELQTVHTFTFSVPLAADGYASQVAALSQAVDELTTQLALSLKQLNTGLSENKVIAQTDL